MLILTSMAVAVTGLGAGVARADDDITPFPLISVGGVVGPPVVIVPPTATGTGGTSSSGVDDVFNVESPSFCGGDLNRCSPVISGWTAGPYDAHSQFYVATDAERAALASLQESAIQSILTLHRLPASDHDAVLAWDRSEIRAVMWEEITQALNTGAAQRTPTQQAVSDYFGVLMQRQSVNSAIAAIREYNKWAGNPSYINLPYDQLSADPAGGASRSVSSPTGTGFCKYHPPGPYDTTNEYGGRTNQLCFTPCTSLLGCDFPQPSYDQFVNWGTWDASNGRFGNATFAGVAQQASAAVALGTAVVGSAAIGAGISATLPSALAGSAIATAITPYSLLGPPWMSVAATPAEELLAIQGSVAAADVAGALGIVVTATVLAVLRGIQVVQNAQLPAKLDQLLDSAETGGPGDATAAITSAAGQQTLYSLFMDATTPEHGGGAIPTLGAPEAFLTKGGRVSTLSYTDGAGLTEQVRANAGWFYITYKDKAGNVISADQPSLDFVASDPGADPPLRTYWHMLSPDGQPQVVGIHNGPQVMAHGLNDCGSNPSDCSYGSTMQLNTPAEASAGDTETVTLVHDQLAITPDAANTPAGTPVVYSTTLPGPNGESDASSTTTFTIDGVPCAANSCTATKVGPHTVVALAADKQTNVTTTLTVRPGPPDRIAITADPGAPQAGAPFTVGVDLTDAYGNPIANATQDTKLALTSSACSGGTCPPCANGTCTAPEPGSYVLSGTFNSYTGTVSVTVLPRPRAKISLTPWHSQIHAGDSLALASEAFDTKGSSMGDVTSATTYTVDGVPCPHGSCTLTRATGSQDATVTATLGSTSTTGLVTVLPAAPVSGGIIVPTGAGTATAGVPATVDWTLTDRYGNVASGNPFNGTLSIENGTCDGHLCTTTVAGVPRVTLTTPSGFVIRSTMLVLPAAADHLVVGSAPATVVAGFPVTYQATVVDRYGNPTWTGDDVPTAAMTQGTCAAATCTGSVAGNQKVTISEAGQSATVDLKVTPGPTTSLHVTPSTGTPQATKPFDVVVRGVDAYGNDTGDLTSATALTVDHGSCGAESCTVTTPGPATVTAVDGQAKGSVEVAVGAPPVTHLTITRDTGAATGTAGTPVTFTVAGTDAAGNDVSPLAVTLEIDKGTCSGLTCTATTAGTRTITATVGTVTATTTLTVRPATASAVVPTAGDGQATAKSTAFATALRATATDAYGNPTTGTTLTFTVTAGAATFVGKHVTAAAVTGANGVAIAPTLRAGSLGGPVTITVSGAGASVATFHLGVTAPATIAGPPATATAGTPYRYSFVVGGFPAPVVTLSGGALPVGLTLSSDGTISGTATKAGHYAICVTASNASKAVSRCMRITVTPAAAAAGVTALNGGVQTVTPGGKFPSPLLAQVTDQFGNPIPGRSVTYTITGSASFPRKAATAVVTTSASGVARSPVITAGLTSGAVTVTASVAGVSVAAVFHLSVLAQATRLDGQAAAQGKGTNVGSGAAPVLQAGRAR